MPGPSILKANPFEDSGPGMPGPYDETSMIFWKIAEFVIRLFYWKRFAMAKKIGKAGETLVAGAPDEALTQINVIEYDKLHESLLTLYHYTKGRILDALRRTDEAEVEFEAVVAKDATHDRARLELAIILGRKFQFPRSRALLAELKKTADQETVVEVDRILDLLFKTVDGRRNNEFKARAEATVNSYNLRAADGAVVIAKLEKWIMSHRDLAAKDIDDIALCIGESLIQDAGGKIAWRISLGMDESVLVNADGRSLNPFEVVDKFIRDLETPDEARLHNERTGFGGSSSSLNALIEQSWA